MVVPFAVWAFTLRDVLNSIESTTTETNECKDTESEGEDKSGLKRRKGFGSREEETDSTLKRKSDGEGGKEKTSELSGEGQEMEEVV